MRELIANALIHQDLSVTGAGPTIDVFSDRLEITNPGLPIINIMRFIDNPPRSRNEILASLMRRFGICEERGSGWDKTALACEMSKLPAPKIDIYEDNIKVTIFSNIPFGKMSQEEKVWSCYMYACLKQINNDQMTNASFRDRFGVPESNKSAISKLISLTMELKLIKALDPNTAPRYMRYIPFWA